MDTGTLDAGLIVVNKLYAGINDKLQYIKIENGSLYFMKDGVQIFKMGQQLDGSTKCCILRGDNMSQEDWDNDFIILTPKCQNPYVMEFKF